MARQPVMVDGSTLRCDAIVSTVVQLGSRSAQESFYAVQGLEYGILGMNLSPFQVQIDVCRAEASGRG